MTPRCRQGEQAQQTRGHGDKRDSKADKGTGTTEIGEINQSLRIGIPRLPPGEECGIRGRSRS
jgi:hypothetical protein